MPAGYQQLVPLLTEGYAGVNTAQQFSQLPREQSPRMQNAYMPKIGAIGKRPGSIPVTTSALAANIEHLAVYKSSPSSTASGEIYASSGVTLYKLVGAALTALTMTNALNQGDIYTFGFTNAGLTSIMVIGDKASLKQCDGAIVKNIVAAANDPSPAPPNQLAAVNAKGARFVWEYSGHVFISPGTNELFYTKRYEFNYVPDTQYFQLVNDNDYVNGCGVIYDSVCLVPMRRGWAVISGVNFDNFDASKFLNTARGVIAPHTVDKITYPTGEQTVVFLSDDGVHEIYIAVLEGGGRIYSTRSIMQETIDFAAIGLTEAEKAAAVGYFDNENIRYMLSFLKNGVNYTWVYDTRNRQWYPDWLTFSAKSYVMLNTVLYFGGTMKKLCKFDVDLYSDWNETTKTTGTPVHFLRYSPLLSFEFSGYSSYWDYYLLEARQWLVPSVIDLYVIFNNSEVTASDEAAWKNSVAVWDEATWDESQWANMEYTDIVNSPNRRTFKKKSKYVQTLWDSPRDEPLEIFKDLWIGRLSGQ
jgi:hypothetical protein